MASQVELIVPESLGGQRLDKVISSLLEVSRAQARSLVDRGARVDGLPARPSERVPAGATIVCGEGVEVPALMPEPLDFDVRYEDGDVIVVDKPAGLVVHPGGGHRTGTLAAGLLSRFPELAGVGDEGRWGLVHRLDKDTSGVLLVARNEYSYRNLKDQLRSRAIGRVYTALVEGIMGSPTGTIDAPIARDPVQPRKRAVTHSGKPARTHYEVRAGFEVSGVSLLSVRLETGRTHQIRVHLAAIDHPVVGDWTYGATRRDLGVGRTFLHASKVEFDHPTTQERLIVEAALPGDLVAVLDSLV